MKFSSITFLFICISLFFSSCKTTAQNGGTSQKSYSKSISSSAWIERKLKEMTLEEKIGQMAQITLDVITEGENRFVSNEPLKLDVAAMESAFEKYAIGSVLNTANNRGLTLEEWKYIVKTIQDKAMQSGANIPVLYGVDAIHGTTYTQGATFFPQQIGLAATYNTDLVEKAARITAYETRASNIPWNFSPVLDMGRDPRFPRIWETFGESPYLTSQMGVAMVKGYQGEDNQLGKDEVAACLKHYVGYGTSYSGKDRTPAFIPQNELLEKHIYAFQNAIDQGARTIMVNSGIINGLPVHANYELLTTILKEQLGFEGIIVTDWADIENLHKRDKVAPSDREAIKMAINAGIDMSMIPYNYEVFCDNLKDLVEKKEVSMARIDDAVRRVLRVKEELNLIEHPYYEISEYPNFGSADHQKIAYENALQSITLLKNKGNILPISKSAKIMITGPNANSIRALNGGWSYSWQGDKADEYAKKYNTIVEAMQQFAGSSNVTYLPSLEYKKGGKYFEEVESNVQAVVEQAKNMDYLVVCLGENSYTEKPGDLNDLELSANQIALVKKLSDVGKPIILVLNEGRPRLINSIEQLCDGIVQVYIPGNYGGDALTNILYGVENPSGKLPYTYPKFANSLITYDYKPSENQEKMTGVYDYESSNDIQFPFGFGLSYTTFKYSNLSLSSKEINAQQTLEVSVDVTNTGKREGNEVVMLFLQDHYASLTPDNKSLKRFKKINLKPNETRKIRFILGQKDLEFVNYDNKWVVEEGSFSVMIENLKQDFQLKK